MSRTQLKSIAFWIATIFGPTSFVIGGVIGLTGSPDAVANLQHLGYPAYFGVLLGAWKLAGALAITVPGLPRLKEWAYAGVTFAWVMAAISAYLSEPGYVWVAPLVLLALLATSYVTRPSSRRIST